MLTTQSFLHFILWVVSCYALMPFFVCVYQGSTWQEWERWNSWRNWSKGLYWYSSYRRNRLNMFNGFLQLWTWTIENIWQAHFKEATHDSKMKYYLTELHEKNMLVQNLLMKSHKKVGTIVSSFMLIYAVFFPGLQMAFIKPSCSSTSWWLPIW